jgi:predicted exporter
MVDRARLRRLRALTIAGLLAVAGIAAWTFTHLDVTTEITHFVPEGDDRELAAIASEMARSDLNRTITLTIKGNTPERTIAAARELTSRIEALEGVDWVRAGPGEDLGEAFYALYFARRFAFADDPATLTDEALRERARELRRRLASPAGTLVRSVAPSDPLLSFASHVDALRASQEGGLAVEEGQLLASDGHAVVFLASRASPFDATASRAFLGELDAAVAAVRERFPELELEESCVHRYTVTAEQTIREDIQRISTLSTIAIVILFVLVFRSPRYVGLTLVPLAIGTIVGLFVTRLAFGTVHGLSVAFGSALIGVGVDYAAHYLSHHVLEPGTDGPLGTLRRVLPGLGVGAATTIAGLAALAYASFPGIRELAVLSSVGVLASFVATCVFVPAWSPESPRPTRVHIALARALSRAVARLRGSRVFRFGVPLIALVLCALGLPRLTWMDDLRALNGLDPARLAEDERVRARVTRMDAGRFVVAWGTSDEEALRANDAVHARLVAAHDAGEVASFRSLHELLPSAASQRARWQAYRDAPGLADRAIAALEAEGFVGSAFQPFRDALGEAPAPLTWDELERSPVGPLAQGFRVRASDGRVGVLTLLRGAELDALIARLAGIPGVHVFDQTRFVDGAYADLRARTSQLVLGGAIVVFLMLFARYRRLGRTVAAFAPAVLSCAVSISIVALLGYEANLMHLLGLLLVASMGEDYGVFMVEAHASDEDVGIPLTSVVVACVTTVFSFGMLALSEHPAMQSIGLVTGLGVLLSFVFAPLAWVFLSRAER